MGQNFLSCDREQELLLPPSLREWLPEGHLAWLVVDAVEALDLDAFYGAYRRDGHGRAAHDPAMMVALLLYSYAVGERSSRAIERRCSEDVASRVICANRSPDHATIARFRARHEQALAQTFTQVLGLCAKAGLVSVGLVAVDGTLIAANASRAATRTHEAIREEVDRILGEAAAVDAAEDEHFGAARGDELPADLVDPRSRIERLRSLPGGVGGRAGEGPGGLRGEPALARRVGARARPQARRVCPTKCVWSWSAIAVS